MKINSKTNIIELSPEEVRKAIVFYLQQRQFNILCQPPDIEVGAEGAAVSKWRNEVEENISDYLEH